LPSEGCEPPSPGSEPLVTHGQLSHCYQPPQGWLPSEDLADILARAPLPAASRAGAKGRARWVVAVFVC
jgi:hypothetical protein